VQVIGIGSRVRKEAIMNRAIAGLATAVVVSGGLGLASLQLAAGTRSFASIEQLPSKRWRVRYTGPDGAIHKAPHTFAARIDAEAYAIAVRRKIDQARWDATDDNPEEQTTFGAYAARWLANRQVAGRPTQGPHPRALQRDPGPPPGAGVRGAAARRHQAQGRACLV
jgi:hypothetical protein